MRHVERRLMFLKDLVREGSVVLRKLKGAENMAIMLTNPAGEDELLRAIKNVGSWRWPPW